MHDTPHRVFTRHPVDWILTSDPAALGLALTVLSAATLLSFLLAVFWLARLPRRAIAPRCAKCRYLLAEPTPARCSECGADLAVANAVRRTARGVRWRAALIALACTGAGLGLQWWIGAGFMPYGRRAWFAVDRWQRSRTDAFADLIAAEVLVARAIEEVSPPGGAVINPRYLAPRNLDSPTRLAALRDAVLDPSTRAKAFAAAREIQSRYIMRGDLVAEQLPETAYQAVRRMLVDAVVLDPTLVGAVPGAGGGLEMPPFAPSGGNEAYRYDHFGFLDDNADLDKQFYFDIPYPNAIIGSVSEIVRVEGEMTHADGRRASRTIRFVAPDPELGMLRPSRIWFVPAPTPDPAKWTVRVEGEIRHRFVSETLRDDEGKPLERVMTQRFRVDIDRVKVERSLP